MEYIAPKIVDVLDATESVQGQKGGVSMDSIDPNSDRLTAAGYPADE